MKERPQVAKIILSTLQTIVATQKVVYIITVQGAITGWEHWTSKGKHQCNRRLQWH